MGNEVFIVWWISGLIQFGESPGFFTQDDQSHNKNARAHRKRNYFGQNQQGNQHPGAKEQHFEGAAFHIIFELLSEDAIEFTYAPPLQWLHFYDSNRSQGYQSTNRYYSLNFVMR